MSELRVDSVKSKGGGAPNLPKGVTISGIATAATLGATTVDVSNVNVSGVVTSATLNGPLLSTGTPTLGLGVTINSSGVAISGVATAGIVSATTLYGDGSNITGLGATLAPLFYNPDLSDSLVLVGTGIGITFNQQIKAGTGNITIRETNASGTVVENFGVGSSVTISENRVSFTPSSDLTAGQVYHLSYPSGCLTNNEGTDYVGTAYTFVVKPIVNYLWVMGGNANGQLGVNNETSYSSPIQVPGTNWKRVNGSMAGYGQVIMGNKTDNTLWAWGSGTYGKLGNNSNVSRSSPVQIPGTTWSTTADQCVAGGNAGSCMKTDGTLWAWGYNEHGQLGQNNKIYYSSPVQIPGTTWNYLTKPYQTFSAIKTDGTLWSWGKNNKGQYGVNDVVYRSSPVQCPGTTWRKVVSGNYGTLSTKTDGTLWYMGGNGFGSGGQNLPMGPGSHNMRSSPIQLTSGTDWNDIAVSMWTRYASKTDGTLYGWGRGDGGSLFATGIGNASRSSPTQLQGGATDFTGSLSACYGRSLFNVRPGD